MTKISRQSTAVLATAAMVMIGSTGLSAQQIEPSDNVLTTVVGSPPADLSGLAEGPELKGYISARQDDKLQVTTMDGSGNVVRLSEGTDIRATKGLFGINRSKLGADALLNGLPVTVETVQWAGNLVATRIKLKNSDLKTAAMIRTGTAQGFAEQTAATEALRGRFGDIDKYNVKGVTNVYFDSGKHSLSVSAREELCFSANTAANLDNALLLVVGYTDSTGSYEINQALSEKRASRVVNFLQQQCGWKPYRMLTPTGMAEADPAASNDTEAGKAQNRRVAVNILVSKSVDGL